MSKKPERSTIVPVTIDPPLAPASVETPLKPVERHSDRLPPKNKLPPNPTAHSSRHSEIARSRPHRRVPGHASLIGRRPATQSISASHRIGKDTTAKSELNRPSLTKEFLTFNEKSVAGTMSKASLIKRARIGLDPKEYDAWVKEDLKLKPYGAKLLFYISEHSILTDSKYWKYFPVDYRSLYELSQIKDGKLLGYIKAGKVHHDLTRGAAKKLNIDSRDSADNNSGKAKIKARLPQPGISDAMAVVRGITRYFVPDQAWKTFDSQNPRPNEIPSKEVIENALSWVEFQRARKRGER